MQEGRSRLVIGDDIHEAVPGEIIVIKAGTPHGFINCGETILRQLDIHLSPRFKQQNLEPTELSRRAALPQPRT
jgi:mannose-6-phosphate isomerase-like protein (cupin superfamily)